MQRACTANISSGQRPDDSNWIVYDRLGAPRGGGEPGGTGVGGKGSVLAKAAEVVEMERTASGKPLWVRGRGQGQVRGALGLE